MNAIWAQPQFYLTWMIVIGGGLAYFGFKKTLFARKRRVYYDQRVQKWKSVGIFGFFKTKILNLSESKIKPLEEHINEIIAKEIDNDKVFWEIPFYLWKWKYLGFFGGMFLILIGCSLLVYFGTIV